MRKWEQLACDRAVGRLASMMRCEYGVWIGFVDHDGRAMALGAAEAPLSRPVCTRFLVNPAAAGRGCAETLRRWGQEVCRKDAVDSLRACHAGLSALLATVEVGGEQAGNVYASGFIAADRQQEQRAEVLGRMDEAGLWGGEGDELRGELVDAIPRLDHAQRTCLGSLLRCLARLAAESLESGPGAIDAPRRFPELIGESEPMRRLVETLDAVVRSDAPVLIRGEGGTGKELVARVIHRNSRRKAAPFVVQSCAASSPERLHGELFGHRKGALDGAPQGLQGHLNSAGGGTLFLDEVAELDLDLQAKMLRVLEEGTFVPVGGSIARKVDARIVCASSRDLEAMVREGRFRQDLLLRLAVVGVETPALRHRRRDIATLAEHFVRGACRRHGHALKELSAEAIVRLEAHPWPGNLRELENEMERVVILTGAREVIEAEDLSLRAPARGDDADVAGGLEELARGNTTLPEAIARLERAMILEGLRRTGWNKTQTAREIGISRRNLIRKVAHYELEDG